MRLIPHSEAWYAWLSEQQKGYFYPWRSTLGAWHGEDSFRALVFEHLRPELDVFEVACAHGELALEIAPHVRSVLGYDVTPGYIDLARQAAEERGITNARFVVGNARERAKGGAGRTPAADQSIDLWVNRKGPFHPILDAPRICRPGAVLLMLVPGGGVPAGGQRPGWFELLPEPFRPQEIPDRNDPNWAYKGITQNLAEAGLRLHSWWDFDVPEYFSEPRELYKAFAWAYMEDEVPAYEQVTADFERIFREFAGPQGLENRWRRSIWKAVVE